MISKLGVPLLVLDIQIVQSALVCIHIDFIVGARDSTPSYAGPLVSEHKAFKIKTVFKKKKKNSTILTL